MEHHMDATTAALGSSAVALNPKMTRKEGKSREKMGNARTD